MPKKTENFDCSYELEEKLLICKYIIKHFTKIFVAPRFPESRLRAIIPKQIFSGFFIITIYRNFTQYQKYDLGCRTRLGC